ncbi:hypothetical protein ACFLXJ_02740 [Chloroflexota bacterium]
MIKRLALFSLLVVILTTTILVSHVALANDPSEFRKQTGGGRFIDWGTGSEPGDKVTFSFTAQTLEPSPEDYGYVLAKGKFQLIDQTRKTRIDGTIDYFWYIASDPWWSSWEGECSINGTDGYYFLLSVLDKDEAPWPEDWIWILIYEEPYYSTNVYNSWLEGERGNIKTH